MSGSKVVRTVLRVGLLLVVIIGATGIDSNVFAQTNSDPLVEIPGSVSNDLGKVPNGTVQNSLLQASQDSISIVVTPANEKELDKLVKEVQNPTSPNYRHFLTNAQFTQKFGADQKSVTALKNYLAAKGIPTTYESNDHLVLGFKGTPSQLDTAFGTKSELRVSDTGETGLINTVPLKLPATLATKIKGVVGFDRLHKPKPASSPNGITASAVANANTPLTLRTAYNISAINLSGTGTRVAITGWSEPDRSELNRWSNFYTDFHPNINNIQLVGSSGVFDDWKEEIQLDSELVLTSAPNTTLVVYAAGRDGTGKPDSASMYWTFKQAIDDGVDVITSSWGGCEAENTSQALAPFDILFQNAVTAGIPVLFASGDAGVFGCKGVNVDAGTGTWPATSPLVTAVGGTRLYRDDTTNVWNTEFGLSCKDQTKLNSCYRKVDYSDGTGGSSGGGVSRYYSRPDYQVNLIVPNESPAIITDALNPMRVIPDISLDGDPDTGIPIFLNNCDPGTNSCGFTGGTSASTPLLAGILALSTQKAGGKIGGINPFLYANCANSTAWCFDIANSQAEIDNGNYAHGFNGVPSRVGWDYVTGLGSVKDVKAFVEALVPVIPAVETGDWEWLNPLPTGNTINAIDCPISTECFAVGNGGALLVTTNGAKTWSVINPGINADLRSISCPSPTTCAI